MILHILNKPVTHEVFQICSECVASGDSVLLINDAIESIEHALTAFSQCRIYLLADSTVHLQSKKVSPDSVALLSDNEWVALCCGSAQVICWH